MSDFYPLKVVDDGSETQIQEGENKKIAGWGVIINQE